MALYELLQIEQNETKGEVFHFYNVIKLFQDLQPYDFMYNY